MKYGATEARLSEASRFRLRLACEDCAHFAVERAACSFEYPNHEHRLSSPFELRLIVYCKAFELV